MSEALSSLAVVVRFLVVVGIVISFHELGHFLAAKALRIKVDVFSIGFGSRLFGKKIGETDYRVAIIPLGGYVRMAGDMADEGHVRSPRDFDAKPAWARLLVMLAGPAFSALLAVLLLTGVYMTGRETPAWVNETPVVGEVEEDSPAAGAGLVVGDLVRSVDQVPTPTWGVLMERIIANPGRRLRLTLDRQGTLTDVEVDVQERGSSGAGWLGVGPCSRVSVRSVNEGTPAEAAGLVAGDAILAVNGRPPCSLEGFIHALQPPKGPAKRRAPIRLLLERDGVERDAVVQPAWDAELGRYVVGIGPTEPMTVERYGVVAALRASINQTREQGIFLVELMGKLLTGRLPVKAMSGSFELGRIISDVAKQGLGPVAELVALISLNLAIFNLLPVPILDGGRMAMILLEAVRGRELDRRTKEWALLTGLAMMVALMVVVHWSDILKMVEG